MTYSVYIYIQVHLHLFVTGFIHNDINVLRAVDSQDKMVGYKDCYDVNFFPQAFNINLDGIGTTTSD